MTTRIVVFSRPVVPSVCWFVRSWGMLVLGWMAISISAHSLQGQETEADPHAMPATHFELGTECALCHSNSFRAVAMRDSQQRGVAPYDLWQSSMMANSSKDPFWKAVLSAEVKATPSLKSTIEEKCTRCHAPMAGSDRASEEGSILSFLKGEQRHAVLGRDGVSCTVCHQMTDEGLGDPASFTGHFQLNQESKIFGPHQNPVTMPMQRHVGYTPTYGNHLMESAMCATCHTLLTTSVDEQGQPTVPGSKGEGNFHEQAPYLEWRNSVFNTEGEATDQSRSCQSCHFPNTDVDGKTISTRLAHNPGGRDFPFLDNRQPFGRHTMVGSNTLMVRILRDNAEELGVTATEKSFDATLEEIGRFLGQKTARLQILEARKEKEGEQWLLPVQIENLAGHKLPTAYPSRRMWIHLTVTNVDGKVVFQSGQYDDQGHLLDAEGKKLASEVVGGPVRPHLNLVDATTGPQVYESIMSDADGKPSFTLLRGADFVKDNRILPKGWSEDDAYAKTLGARGIGDDGDFRGGQDTVTYRLNLPPGEYQVSAELCFQVISPRHADELFQVDTPEVAAFKRYFEAADRKPEVLAGQKTSWMVRAPE